MKSILIAAALLLVAPAAAQAQVAAAAVPNTFDRPAGAPAPAPARLPNPAPAPAPLSPTPADARSEDVLRDLIASARAGAWNYALMTDDLANQYRGKTELLPIINGFGALQGVQFVGSRDEFDIYAVTFATEVTEWVIGIDDAGKVAALLFRPAPAE